MDEGAEATGRLFHRRNWLRRFVRRHAVFYRLMANVLPRYRLCAVRPESHVLIEGFPRSANTFAVVALKMSQPHSIHVGRHLHSLGHVRRGLELGKPALIVIRHPRDAVLSLAIAHPELELASLLTEYIDFYEGIEKLGDAVVLGDFNEVTSDFGAVTRRLNARFGTNFHEFEPTPENLQRCYQLIDDEDRRNTGGVSRPTRVARPTAERDQKKLELSSRLEQSPVRDLLASAEKAYSRLLGKHGLAPAAAVFENRDVAPTQSSTN
jgi:hypothetical protein